MISAKQIYILSTGYLLADFSYLHMVGLINNTILPKDAKKINASNQGAILKDLDAIDQLHNQGKLTFPDFCEFFRKILCKVLEIDSESFVMDMDKMTRAWNAMLGKKA